MKDRRHRYRATEIAIAIDEHDSGSKTRSGSCADDSGRPGADYGEIVYVLYRHKVFEPFELQADLLPGSVTHLGNLLDPFHAGFRRFGKWREREDFAQAGSR
jgi:hypothetical protein